MGGPVAIEKSRRRGRGAGQNASGRFDRARIEEADGWDIPRMLIDYPFETTRVAVNLILQVRHLPVVAEL